MDNNSTIYQLQPLGRFLSLTGKRFLHRLNERLSELDIERDYFALMLIEQGEGNLTQKELAHQLETDKVSVVRVVDYLSAKGYVQRVGSSVDRRKYCLTLTDKAKEVLPGIKKSMQEITATAFEGLTGAQQGEFISTLYKIKKNLSKAKNFGL